MRKEREGSDSLGNRAEPGSASPGAPFVAAQSLGRLLADMGLPRKENLEIKEKRGGSLSSDLLNVTGYIFWP